MQLTNWMSFNFSSISKSFEYIHVYKISTYGWFTMDDRFRIGTKHLLWRKRQHVFFSILSFSTPCSCLLRLAVTCLLRARVRDFSAHFAIKCSSLCTTNQGTSKRSPASSTGFTDYPSVSTSNKLLERSGMEQYPVMPSSLYMKTKKNQVYIEYFTVYIHHMIHLCWPFIVTMWGWRPFPVTILIKDKFPLSHRIKT